MCRYGQSRPPERDFPLDFYQRDANDGAALMAALGHTRYAVMGWSDGAISSVFLAAAHAPNVDRLVMFGGNAYLTKVRNRRLPPPPGLCRRSCAAT